MVVTREQLQSEYPSLWFCIISLKTILSNLPGANETRVFEINPHWNKAYPDSKVYGANTGPTWVLLAPDGPHVGPMNLAIRVLILHNQYQMSWIAANLLLILCGFLFQKRQLVSKNPIHFSHTIYSLDMEAVVLCFVLFNFHLIKKNISPMSLKLLYWQCCNLMGWPWMM